MRKETRSSTHSLKGVGLWHDPACHWGRSLGNTARLACPSSWAHSGAFAGAFGRELNPWAWQPTTDEVDTPRIFLLSGVSSDGEVHTPKGGLSLCLFLL